MIIKRRWFSRVRNQKETYGWTHHYIQKEGWFLFGFLPLYIRDLGTRRQQRS